VRFTPKLTPDANSIMLLGPGVTDVTKANMAMAATNSTLKFIINAFFEGDWKNSNKWGQININLVNQRG
jgi:hypothetical protein